MTSKRLTWFGAVASLGMWTGTAAAAYSQQPVTLASSSDTSGGGGGTETGSNDGSPDCTTTETGVNSDTGFERSASCSKTWGGETFGAYYELGGGIAATTGASDTWSFDGGMEIGLWVFGHQKALYDASVYFDRKDTGGADGEAYLAIGNDVITNPDGSGLAKTMTHDWKLEQSFWRPPAASYYVGPFTLSIEAELSGELGLLVENNSSEKLHIIATPHGGVYLEATASVSLIDESIIVAGVTGDLSLIEVELPIKGVARLTDDATDTYEFKFDIDMVLTTLAGKVTAWADLLGHSGDGHDYSTIIAEWEGVSRTLEVFGQRDGSVSLD